MILEKFEEWVKEGEKIYKELEKAKEENEKAQDIATVYEVLQWVVEGNNREEIEESFPGFKLEEIPDQEIRALAEKVLEESSYDWDELGGNFPVYFDTVEDYNKTVEKIEDYITKLEDLDVELEKQCGEIEDAMGTIEEVMENWLGQEKEEE